MILKHKYLYVSTGRNSMYFLVRNTTALQFSIKKRMHYALENTVAKPRGQMFMLVGFSSCQYQRLFDRKRDSSPNSATQWIPDGMTVSTHEYRQNVSGLTSFQASHTRSAKTSTSHICVNSSRTGCQEKKGQHPETRKVLPIEGFFGTGAAGLAA